MLPMFGIVAGFQPQFTKGITAAGLPNTTSIISNIIDNLPNATVRCLCAGMSCLQMVFGGTQNHSGLLQAYDQVVAWRAANNVKPKAIK